MPGFSNMMAEMIARSRPQQAPPPGRVNVASGGGEGGIKHKGKKTAVAASVDAGALMRLLGHKTPEEKREIGQRYVESYNTASESDRVAMGLDPKIVQTWDQMHKAGVDGFVKGENDTHARPMLWSEEERALRKAKSMEKDDYIALGGPEAENTLKGEERLIEARNKETPLQEEEARARIEYNQAQTHLATLAADTEKIEKQRALQGMKYDTSENMWKKSYYAALEANANKDNTREDATLNLNRTKADNERMAAIDKDYAYVYSNLFGEYSDMKDNTPEGRFPLMSALAASAVKHSTDMNQVIRELRERQTAANPEYVPSPDDYARNEGPIRQFAMLAQDDFNTEMPKKGQMAANRKALLMQLLDKYVNMLNISRAPSDDLYHEVVNMGVKINLTDNQIMDLLYRTGISETDVNTIMDAHTPDMGVQPPPEVKDLKKEGGSRWAPEQPLIPEQIKEPIRKAGEKAKEVAKDVAASMNKTSGSIYDVVGR